MAKTKHLMACISSECNATFSPKEVLFECLNYVEGKDRCNHPYSGQPPRFGNRTIFRPNRRRFAPNAICPHCGTPSNILRCPENGCFSLLPVGMGQPSTIAVVGAADSGKTCYIAGLLRQIKKELARDEQYQMSLEFMDDKGREYFRTIHNTIFHQNGLPPASQKGTPVSMSATIRFPLRSWYKRFFARDQADVPLVFPDPAGELFHNMDDVTFLTYLNNASGLILAIDPLAETSYRTMLKKAGKSVPTYTTDSAYDALTTLVRVLRNFTQQPNGRLNKNLAIFVTKCDEYGVFDPDDDLDQFPNQGRRYNPKLTGIISRRVESYLEDELDLPEIGALARRNFKHVAFFAGSSFGAPPVNGKLVNPHPRRVEEPLLWILHRWGYL